MTIRTFPGQKFPRKSVLGAASALLLAACSSGTESRNDDLEGLPTVGEARLRLVRSEDCDALLTRIQDGVLVQLAARAEQLKQGEAYDNGSGVDFGSGGNGGVAIGEDAPTRGDTPGELPTAPPSVPGSAADPSVSPAPTAPSGNPGGGAVDEDGGGSFSGTTVQVKDVDEADIVKTDGDRIYLLHGGTLFVLQGWPANATEILGSTLIEGQPTEMFVNDGKAVVFSSVYGDIDGPGANDANFYYGNWGYTKISVLDVTGAQPALLRESFVEGGYTSSRRHGDVVRAVIQDGFKIPQLGSPNIEYRDAFGQPYPQADIDAQVDNWLARTARSIRSTDLGAWLPREFARQGGDLVAVAPRCGDYYSPDPGLTQTGVTSVVSLDLADVAAPLGGATILGGAERVYSNEDVVLITQTDYRYAYDADATEQTIIHRFDIAGNGTAYTATGAVAGSINDQFSLDERAGIIRVSTTEQPWARGGIAFPTAPPSVDVTDPAPTPIVGVAGAAGAASAGAAAPGGAGGAAPDLPASDADVAPQPPTVTPPPVAEGPTSVSRVVTLGTDGDSLKVLGSTEEFGQTERIYATRFIGDRGYVVTFRQTDPLFVIDLADPTDPHVVGELHIPGFSNYLFPLDQDHLFAIGRDATSTGQVQGLALQVFDVSDPAAPALSAKYVYPDTGDSPANVDHRAITFHPDRNVVAFPHRSWSTGESTLEVFALENTSISRIGGMGMADTIDFDECFDRYYGYTDSPEVEQLRAQAENDPAWQREILSSCNYGQEFRRGLFRDDFVYGVSTNGVYVYDITAMNAGAVGEVSLPAPVYDSGDYAYGGGVNGGMGTPPSNGTPPGEALPVPVDAAPPSMGGAAGAGSAGASAGGSPGSKG